jgi:hypothetical protein
MVEGRHVHWSYHLDIAHVLSKVLRVVKGAEGWHAGHLLRTFQGEFCAMKRQMQVAVKGSTTGNQKYEEPYLVFRALCIQHGNKHISVTVSF